MISTAEPPHEQHLQHHRISDRSNMDHFGLTRQRPVSSQRAPACVCETFSSYAANTMDYLRSKHPVPAASSLRKRAATLQTDGMCHSCPRAEVLPASSDAEMATRSHSVCATQLHIAYIISTLETRAATILTPSNNPRTPPNCYENHANICHQPTTRNHPGDHRLAATGCYSFFEAYAP
jgi:hypothetical protein